MSELFDDIRTYAKGVRLVNSIESNVVYFVILETALWVLAPFVNIVMSSYIIDELAGDYTAKSLVTLVLLTVTLNILASLTSNFVSRYTRAKKNVFEDELEMTLSKKVMTLDYATIESAEMQALITRMREDGKHELSGVWTVISSIYYTGPSFFKVVFATAITISAFFRIGGQHSSPLIAFATSPWASVILLAIIFGSIAYSSKSGKQSAQEVLLLMDQFAPFNRFYFYYLNNYLGSYHAGKDIRIYNQKDLVISEQMSNYDIAERTANQIANSKFRFEGLNQVTSVFTSSMVFAFTGLKALGGLVSIGDIVKYSASINQFVSGFAGVMSNIGNARANLKRLQMFLDFLALPEAKHSGSLPVPKNGRLEFEIRDLTFRYPGTELNVLQNISLRINPAEKWAIVGMNGSGKTTLIKLLCRLYEPVEGQILLNGIDVRQYKYDEYLELFSVVFQDFAMYSSTLGQNIAAAVSYDNERVMESLQKAGFGERLKSLDKGLETELYRDFDPNGVEISGGEAQKIALARAVYKDAPIMILDEPTAALDPLAEYEMYSNFNGMVGQKTAIYISHRLSSCRFCDVIAVIDNGKLIEYGSHEALLAQHGKYKELWTSQAQYYV